MRPLQYHLSAAFCCALTLTFCGTALPAFAAEEAPRTENGMTYELTEHDTLGIAVCITGYTAELPRALVIPAELGGYPVLEIQAGAFRNAPLDTVVIAEGITAALPNAFSGSTLREITLPKSLSCIETGLCAGCVNLTALHIAEGITEIGSSAFLNCSALTAIELPESITVLGSRAFAGCDALTEVTLGENVQEVGALTFNRCENLRSVTFLNPACRISQVSGTVSNGSDAQMIPYYYGVIRGASGSAAEQFAQNAGLAFSVIGARTRGDLNGDGAVSLDDAQTALAAYTAALSGLPDGLSAEERSAADADLDGSLTLRDAQLILCYYVTVTLTGTDAGWDEILSK